MNLTMIVALLLFSLFSCSLAEEFQASNLYDLVLQSQERGASCIDGSAPGLYIHEGSEVNKDKYLIYFEGGGFCGALTLQDTIQSCYNRSSTNLGSTRAYPKTKSFEKQGLLSPLQSENPVFYDWTKIFVIYCDGSVHQGHRQSPISFKGKNLYFRGTTNTMEHFSFLQSKYNWYNGKAIVITGVSAGGMGAYQWVSYLSKNTISAKVMAVPDSGFFITDYYSELAKEKVLRLGIGNLIKLVNVESDFEDYLPEPVHQCIDKPVAIDLVDCYNSANYVQYLQGIPILAIQSPVDAYSLANIVIASKCFTNRQPPYSLSSCDDVVIAAIEDYRKESLRYLGQMRRYGKSAWSPVCVQHGFSNTASFTDDRFQVQGFKVVDAVSKFVSDNLEGKNLKGEEIWLVDEGAWPSNTGCSGIDNNLEAAQLEEVYRIVGDILEQKQQNLKKVVVQV